MRTTIALVATLIMLAGLGGFNIGYGIAKKEYFGGLQDAWRHYGCKPWNEAPNGECK